MEPFIVMGLLVTVAYAVFAEKLRAWHITQPVALIAVGAVAGALFAPDLGSHLNTRVAEQVVEIVLALLLFADATEVRGRPFGARARLSARLILIALPVSIIGATLLGAWFFPGISVATLVIVACVVLPTDLATASLILSDSRVPSRIRHTLNIESGYNDAIVSPTFLVALAVAAGAQASPGAPFQVLEEAVLPFVLAVVVGAAVGGAAGAAVRWAVSRSLTTATSIRIGVAVLPFLTYVISVAVHGNGFVAAFVAGLTYRALRTRGEAEPQRLPHAELTAVEDIGRFASAAIWFVLGGVLALVFETGLSWIVLVYAVLALTLLRQIPVALALLGTQTNRAERLSIGLLGPRGPASIVFGLLAYNVLKEDQADLVLSITVVVVAASAVLHGVFAPGIAASLLGNTRRAGSSPG